ncbi:hypothetical protein MMC25_000102 [Agyrium rufum]|nr:hypothetical protein [Agyrium rufum]
MFDSYLVTPEQLATALESNQSERAQSKRVIPLCSSWFLPNDPQGRTGQQVFKEKRIPGARFFDLDAVRDHDSSYPHMLPTAEGFAQSMREMGLRKDDILVAYDSQELGIFSAPRVGWTLRVFGHPHVHVLNNFRLWIEGGFPTESGAVNDEMEENSYPVPTFNPDMVVNFREMKQIAKEVGKEDGEKTQILDARSYGRWAGTESEPRPGLSSGHIPGSTSVALPELLDPKTKTLLAGDKLRRIFESKGLDPELPIISSCGTGVTAAVIDAALQEAGFGRKDDRRLYDGSWTEWAQRVSGKDDFIVKKK